MTAVSTNATNPYAYLQSWLQSGTGTSGANQVSDPLASLFAAFTGAGNGSPSASAGNTATGSQPVSGLSPPTLSPSTLAALFSLQQQSSSSTTDSSALTSLFDKFDANGNGQISQSEFEQAIGPNADTSKVDALFAKIDSNGDGQISQDELGSAIQQAQSRFHHHHMHGAGQGGGSGGLADLLNGTDASGATTQTITNSDGSTTTTMTYADGTTISMTTPAPASGSSSGGTGTDGTGTGDAGGGGSSSQSQGTAGSNGSGRSDNLLETLFKLQSQLLVPAAETALTLGVI